MCGVLDHDGGGLRCFEQKAKGHGYVTRKYESATWVMAHHCNPDPAEAARLCTYYEALITGGWWD